MAPRKRRSRWARFDFASLERLSGPGLDRSPWSPNSRPGRTCAHIAHRDGPRSELRVRNALGPGKVAAPGVGSGGATGKPGIGAVGDAAGVADRRSHHLRPPARCDARRRAIMIVEHGFGALVNGKSCDPTEQRRAGTPQASADDPQTEGSLAATVSIARSHDSAVRRARRSPAAPAGTASNALLRSAASHASRPTARSCGMPARASTSRYPRVSPLGKTVPYRRASTMRVMMAR